MVKHNNVVPGGHFRKNWQNYVKALFNQPARNTRRRIARQKKTVKIFPRPTAGPLRPIVHGQTLKYNMKVRACRGFSLEELKASQGNLRQQLASLLIIVVETVHLVKSKRSKTNLQALVKLMHQLCKLEDHSQHLEES